MRKFNLKEALSGAKLVYRNGKEVKHAFTFDGHLSKWLYFCDELYYNKKGRHSLANQDSELDLFMAEVKPSKSKRIKELEKRVEQLENRINNLQIKG